MEKQPESGFRKPLRIRMHCVRGYRFGGFDADAGMLFFDCLFVGRSGLSLLLSQGCGRNSERGRNCKSLNVTNGLLEFHVFLDGHEAFLETFRSNSSDQSLDVTKRVRKS